MLAFESLQLVEEGGGSLVLPLDLGRRPAPADLEAAPFRAGGKPPREKVPPGSGGWIQLAQQAPAAAQHLEAVEVVARKPQGEGRARTARGEPRKMRVLKCGSAWLTSLPTNTSTDGLVELQLDAVLPQHARGSSRVRRPRMPRFSTSTGFRRLLAADAGAEPRHEIGGRAAPPRKRRSRPPRRAACPFLRAAGSGPLKPRELVGWPLMTAPPAAGGSRCPGRLRRGRCSRAPAPGGAARTSNEHEGQQEADQQGLEPAAAGGVHSLGRAIGPSLARSPSARR